MRLLLVGDPHVTADELTDSQALLDGVFALYGQLEPDMVVFMGDLHHNHALVRVEVTDFWLRNLSRFPAHKVAVILGNHDRPNDASSEAHALQAYRKLCTVVDQPTWLFEDFGKPHVLAMPYYHSKEDFVNEHMEESKPIAPLVTLCHQTFDGSKYENGFYAPDGLDPRILGAPRVISGHIHTAQTITWEGGYVQYIGSPRWRSISDANEAKSVVLYDTVQDTFTLFDTSEWCSPIGKAAITNLSQIDNIPFVSNPKARLHVDVVGQKAEVEVQIVAIKNRLSRAKLRPVYTDQSNKKLAAAESEGVFNALRKYMASYKPQFGTKPDLLESMIVNRLSLGEQNVK